jgi:hypothetical protein
MAAGNYSTVRGKRWARQQKVRRVAWGRYLQDKGRRSEERLLAVCGPGPARPDWVQEVARATPKEDAQGVDIVVSTTDIGKIYIQVKSSEGGRRLFLMQRRSSRIAVVVVKNFDTEESLQRKFLTTITSERAYILSLRQKPE